MTVTPQTLQRLEVGAGHIAYAVEGSGAPPVLLLHAGYVDHRMYSRELRRLGRRTTTVVPDARTHGRSSTALAPFRHCDDVAALVRHLDLGPAVLIGTSMGAGTAVDTALEHPDTVRALVLSGAGTNEPSFTSARALELQRRAEEAIARQDVAAWLDATLSWAPGPGRDPSHLDPGVRELLSDLHQDFVRTHIRPGVTPPEHVTGSWERLGEIGVPVLGLVGELDFPDHQEMTQRAVAAVPDSRGVVRIPRAGHFPNLEQPLAWDRAVDAFLEEVLAP